VVFVTSHQAHFIRTTPTMEAYAPVALSKRAGEDALRERIPALAEKGIDFVVVSADMIEGTITATLLNRLEPGAIDARREEAGKLLNVAEFAAEIAQAAIDEIPEHNERICGDTSSFTPIVWSLEAIGQADFVPPGLSLSQKQRGRDENGGAGDGGEEDGVTRDDETDVVALRIVEDVLRRRQSAERRDDEEGVIVETEEETTDDVRHDRHEHDLHRRREQGVTPGAGTRQHASPVESHAEAAPNDRYGRVREQLHGCVDERRHLEAGERDREADEGSDDHRVAERAQHGLPPPRLTARDRVEDR